MINKHFFAHTVLLTGTAIGLVATPALAQNAPANSAELTAEVQPDAITLAEDGGEIVVTARRREESLKDVPIAVTVFSGTLLERQGATDITDIGDTTPNVTIETSRGTNSTLTPSFAGSASKIRLPGLSRVSAFTSTTSILTARKARCSTFTTSSGSKCCAGRKARSTAATPLAAQLNMSPDACPIVQC